MGVFYTQTSAAIVHGLKILVKTHICQYFLIIEDD